MRFRLFALTAFVLGNLVISSGADTQDARPASYKVDPVHSSVVFRIKHLNVSYFYGLFSDVQGRYLFDPADPGNSRFEFQVRASSVDTDNTKRDSHLKSPDFFNVKKYPKISFTSTKVTKAEKKEGDDVEARYEIEGDLTLLGVTKPIKVTLDYIGGGTDPWGGYRTGFESVFTVKRSEFGMKTMLPDGLGDEVRIMVGIEGIRN